MEAGRQWCLVHGVLALMRILVTGSRDFEGYGVVVSALRKHKPTFLYHGAAGGLDSLVELWAKTSGQVDYQGFPAKWTLEGNSAGPRRNSRMLKEALEKGLDMCLAFPGGTGTADMVRKAERAGIPVVRVEVPPK